MKTQRRFVVLAFLGLAVALAAIVGGFVLDFRGFAGNALAELAGVIFSVLLAVFVVDRSIDRHRRARWSLVSEQTAQTLDDAIVRAALVLYLRLEAPRPSSADPFTMRMVSRDQLGTALRQLAVQLGALDHRELARTEEWLPDVEKQIQVVRGAVMPRLFALGEANLVAAVAGVEGAYNDLMHEIWLGESFGLEALPTAVGHLVTAMACAVEALVDL